MKRKQKMQRINLTVPSQLKREMEKHSEINWSAVATKSFERFLRANRILRSFEEPELSESEALERALRIQHGKAAIARES